MKIKKFLTLFIFGVILAGSAFAPVNFIASDGDAHPLVGNAAPGFTLKNYEGTDVSLSDFSGQTVVMVFWHPT